MAESEKKEQSSTETPEWEKHLRNFLAAVPPVDPATLSSAEQTLKYLAELAQKVPESLSNTIKTMIELLQQFTNIKGVDVRLKSLRILDLRMHILKEADIPVNRDLAGIGKIECIRLSKLIHLQAEIGEGNKDLKAHIHEGLSFVISIVFVGKQVIPMKGTAKLVRDSSGQFLVETTSYVPGTDVPVTLSFPLKQILDEVRKQL